MIEDDGKGRTPPTDCQRRKVLIAAAATAALGEPVRILDIRAVSRWARKGRAGVRPASPAPFLRRSSTASQPEPGPALEPETERGGDGQ